MWGYEARVRPERCWLDRMSLVSDEPSRRPRSSLGGWKEGLVEVIPYSELPLDRLGQPLLVSRYCEPEDGAAAVAGYRLSLGKYRYCAKFEAATCKLGTP